jgi:hypothetical protein
VDGAMFGDMPVAALMVLEDKLINNGILFVKDTFYKKIQRNNQVKMNFKLLDTSLIEIRICPGRSRKSIDSSMHSV